MDSLQKLLLIFLLFFHGKNCFADSNNTLYEVIAFNAKERSVLYSIHVMNEFVLFLNGVTNEAGYAMYILVDQCCTNEFERTLRENDIEYVPINDAKMLEEFNEPPEEDFVSTQAPNAERIPSLKDKILDWTDIIAWIQARTKKNSLLQKINIGETYEKRELIVLKISNRDININKPAVFILGGEQATDWMSPQVILRFLSYLLQNIDKEEILKYYDFYLMPVFNPDGYEYSFKEDRFWTKNRKQFFPTKICRGDNEEQLAIGVNIDRNWFQPNSVFVSDAECNNVYLGHKALSEEEPLALSMYLNDIAEKLIAFINLRGFAKLITLPYAEPQHFANNYAVVIEMLLHAADKVFTMFNTSYNLCSTASCLYNHTGNAPDWVKRNLNVPIVYTLYIKDDETFFPRLDQLYGLSQQFKIIVNETLILANSIYGPLFDCQPQMLHSQIVIVVEIVLIMLISI